MTRLPRFLRNTNSNTDSNDSNTNSNTNSNTDLTNVDDFICTDCTIDLSSSSLSSLSSPIIGKFRPLTKVEYIRYLLSSLSLLLSLSSSSLLLSLLLSLSSSSLLLGHLTTYL